jgi:hypothetical protein
MTLAQESMLCIGQQGQYKVVLSHSTFIASSNCSQGTKHPRTHARKHSGHLQTNNLGSCTAGAGIMMKKPWNCLNNSLSVSKS